MNFLEKLNKDMTTTMKNKDSFRLTVLRSIKQGLQMEQIDKKRELTDEVLIDVVSRQVKQRNESKKEFTNANRLDLAEKEERELVILQEYLPKALSEEEVEAIIDQVFAKVNPTSEKDMGLIMKEIMPLTKGKTDSKELSNKIKERLNR